MGSTSIEREISTGVIIGRLLLFLAAAAAFVVAVALSQRDDPAASSTAAQYVCPMHPQVTSTVPGDCPICNMALEPMRDAKKGQAIAATRNAFDEVKRRVVTQVVRAPASLGPGGVVTAVLYKESLQGLAPGDKAVFFRSAQPATPLSVRLTSDPVAPWDSSTVQVRFTSEESPLSERDTGWLQLAARPREFLVVPTSSVLYSGDGAYVLAAAPGGHSFTRRSIQIGRNLDSGYVADLAAERLGAVVVLSGLSEGERVVTADTFFLDAERRLRGAQGKAEEVVE
jgi:Heavy metal binding domain